MAMSVKVIIIEIDMTTNMIIYIGPGYTVQCCHGHVSQSEVEKKTVGGCPHPEKSKKNPKWQK